MDAPPLCACGCGQPVHWSRAHGWSEYRRGHFNRGRPGTRLGAVTSEETKQKQREAHQARWAGKRLRDREEKPGRGVYQTAEYQRARKAIEGLPCERCGSTENVGAHHLRPGDDFSLVPRCSKCHPTAHAAPGAHGQHPPPGEQPPLCACGCGQPVRWKRVRGWGRFLHGHACAKVPAGTRLQEAPLCVCGCGQRVKFRFGKGWGEYRRGHRGAHRARQK